MPTTSALRPILAEYEATADPNLTWYFPFPMGFRRDADGFSHGLRHVSRVRGLAWHCGLYRHTFGSQLAMKGESLYKISELMGNSPEICRRHYAVLHLDSLVDCVEFSCVEM